MNLANLLHLFVIILLLSFTANENNKFAENVEIEHYNIRVELSHLQRYAHENPKDEEAKAKIAQLKRDLLTDKELHMRNFNITAIKMVVVLFFFLLALLLFIQYFRIDFSDPSDILRSTNYRRKTWLLNFVLFFTVSFWCLYFRNNQTWAAISYLVAIGALVRSLFLATELQLISKKAGGTEFKFTTIFTAFILYFNLLLLGGMYYASVIAGVNIITWLIELNN